MVNILTRKLEVFGPLPDADKALLNEVLLTQRDIPARTDFHSADDAADHLHVMMSGFACRYKYMKSGRRQIVAYLMPGDFCNLPSLLPRPVVDSIASVTTAEVADVSVRDVQALLNRPAIARAFLMTSLAEEDRLSAWVANGRRPAVQRVAHFCCELYARGEVVGLAANGTMPLPMTQNEIADVLGLSVVHLNRSLQKLRADHLIKLERGDLSLLAIDRLVELGGFQSNYLHLRKATFVNDISTQGVSSGRGGNGEMDAR